MTSKLPSELPNDVERLYACREHALKAYAQLGRDDFNVFECAGFFGIAATEHRFRRMIPVTKVSRAEATRLIFEMFANGDGE